MAEGFLIAPVVRSRMDHALVVVDASDGAKRLVREAGDLAKGVDAELTLLHVTDEDEYNDKTAAMASIPEANVSYSHEQAEEGGRQFVRDVAREALPEDIDFNAVGDVGERVDAILHQAERLGCDHIFIAGRQRSPTGKALFGDVAQSVILDFDGAVTIVTE